MHLEEIYGKIVATKQRRSFMMEKKLKIVVADEGSPLSENLAKTFKAYGMSVSLCEKDGRKVIEFIKKEKYH